MSTLGNEYRKNFRENLKSFRLNRGLTQAELAVEANYDSTYVGKLERGASSPSFDTIVRLGEALDVYPLKLLRPSRAHLDIREELPKQELEALPYNPLDIQIFDSLPSAMGIISDQGTPVYLNDAFIKHTGISRDDVEDQKIWNLPCWKFEEISSQELKDSIERIHFEEGYVQFKLTTGNADQPTIDFFLYPTPINYEPEDRMMWIFEFRHPSHEPIDFPLNLKTISKLET